MKMPSRNNYLDGTEFLTAINQWMAASESAYQFLKGLYEATPESDGRPEWLDSAPRVKNVSVTSAPSPDALEPVLRNLSNAVLNDGCKIIRISHGMLGAAWAIFAEMQPLAEAAAKPVVVEADPGEGGLAIAKIMYPHAVIVQRARPAQ